MYKDCNSIVSANIFSKQVGNTIVIISVALMAKAAYFIFASYILQEPMDLGILKRNDSYWYEQVASDGHEKITPDQLGKCEDGDIEQSYYAFFPLYPAIIGATIAFTGVHFNAVAFGYSLLFSLLLFIVFYRYVSLYTGNGRIGFLAVLFLMLFPFHYYFSVFYTEALFLLLLVGCFFALEKKQLLLFGALASLLVVVRPNGLFMLIPLGIYFLEKYHGFTIQKVPSPFAINYVKAVVFLAPVAVFLFYCAYLYYMTGDFFAYKTAQTGWCRETVWPWEPIIRAGSWKEYFKIAYLGIFMVVSLLAVRKIPISFTVLIWINLLLPLFANSITLPRFISAIFVFPIIFADWTIRFKSVFALFIMLVLFTMQLWSFSYWLRGDEFSF